MAESGFLLSLLSEVLIRRLAIVQSSLVTLYLPQLHSEGDSFRRTNFLYCSLKARILWELDETRFELAHGGLLCLSGWKQCFLHLLWSSTELDFIIPTQPNLSQKKNPKKQKRTAEKGRGWEREFCGPYLPFIELWLCSRHQPQQVTWIVSLNPHLWDREFYYSHLQMREPKLRINNLSKSRYLVPITAQIWD